MNLIPSVILGLSLGVLLLSAWRWRQQDRQRAKRRAEPVDTQECRLAVHEAGHALAAWACFLVDKITVLRIEPSHGLTRYRWWSPRYRDDHDWCDLVIGLAGPAAEVMVYRHRLRTSEVKEDLIEARTTATSLVDRKALMPPWEVGDVQPIPAAHLFVPPLSAEERRCLDIAYTKATELLREGAERHARLVAALLCHRQMSYPQVLSVLGERYWMMAKVISSVLKRPEAMRAGFVKIEGKASSTVRVASPLPVAADPERREC